VFQSADAKTEPPSFAPPATAGFFMRGKYNPLDAFRPVKTIAQTMSFDLPGI
jgi:hypothetical protein